MRSRKPITWGGLRRMQLLTAGEGVSKRSFMSRQSRPRDTSEEKDVPARSYHARNTRTRTLAARLQFSTGDHPPALSQAHEPSHERATQLRHSKRQCSTLPYRELSPHSLPFRDA